MRWYCCMAGVGAGEADVTMMGAAAESIVYRRSPKGPLDEQMRVLAARIRGSAPFLVAVMEGGRGQVYARVYDREGRPLGEGTAGPLADVLGTLPGEAAFVGDAVAACRDEIARAQPAARFPERSL